MLKSHPSRYATGQFECCKAKIWHNFIGYPWSYYYEPTGKKLVDFAGTTFEKTDKVESAPIQSQNTLGAWIK